MNSTRAFASEYLSSHALSTPSYRYITILWMILISFALFYALVHQIRWSGGPLGRALQRWGMRRQLFGSEKLNTRNRALPNNRIVLVFSVLTCITLILCLVGVDYLTPSAPFFSLHYPSNGHINKSFWTSAARFGDMAFALMPLAILFALKAPPFAILATRFFTQLAWDKLIVLHRWSGWLIFSLTTLHVVLWTVQLAKDQYNGRQVFFAVWSSPRFVFGAVAYVAMTALMLLSTRRMRKNHYQVFYVAHVLLDLLTLILSALHHPPLLYWMVIAGGLWATERTYRAIRTIRNNKFDTVQARFPAVRPFPPLPISLTGSTNSTDSTESSPTSLRTPYFESSGFPLTSTGSDDKDVTDDTKSVSPPIASAAPYGHIAQQTKLTDKESGSSSSRPVIAAPLSIPLGYAQAQLLPGDTVRLTIRVPKPFKWAPGQSVLLCLPDLAAFQSHPFTIVNNDSSEITLLIKARKGLTRKLYQWVSTHRQRAIERDVEAKRHSSASTQSTGGDLVVQAPPVLLRAILDGPFGSADRVKWGEYSTVVIFCGGSGISFGASVLEYICGQLSQVGLSTSPRFKTTRLRFCWIVREFAEVAWIASHLRRCHLMVLPDQVQIEIFVTRAPQATTNQGGLRDRRDTINGNVSGNSSIIGSVLDTDDGYSVASVDRSAPITYEDPVDLTNYDDETDIDDPDQQRLSSRLEQQGKLRRQMSSAAGPSALRQTWNIESDEKEVTLARGTSMPQPHGISRDASRQESRLLFPEPSYIPKGVTTTAASSLTEDTPWFSHQDIPSLAFSQDIESNARRNINLLSLATRTTGVVALDESDPTGAEAAKSLWIDEADFAAMSVLSEVTHTGRPRIDAVIEQELIASHGDVIVATCGPTTLDTVVRNSVALCSSPERMKKGNRKFKVDLYSEDYET